MIESTAQHTVLMSAVFPYQVCEAKVLSLLMKKSLCEE